MLAPGDHAHLVKLKILIMKKLVLFFGLLALFTVSAIAQEVEPPANWGEVIDGFSSWFGTLAGIAALTVFIGGVLNGLLKVTKKVVKQILTWIVANLINMGFLSEATWLMTLLYGFGAGLVANGLFDISIVHALILAVESALNKKK